MGIGHRMLHKNIVLGDTHLAHNWSYANAAPDSSYRLCSS